MNNKVEFKKRIISTDISWKFQKEDQVIIPELKQDIKEEVTIKGNLRQWISFKNEIVGIIELADGNVEIVPSSNIKFLKKRKKTTQ